MQHVNAPPGVLIQYPAKTGTAAKAETRLEAGYMAKFIYKLSEKFMFRFENSKIKALRRFSDKCYDYCFQHYHPEEFLPAEPDPSYKDSPKTPCGCRYFDCSECCNRTFCSQEVV